MARKPDVQYIRYYTDGSAAKQILEKPRKKMKYASSKAPRMENRTRTLYVDPLALGGILISAVMLVLMLVGTVELFSVRQQADRMEMYVSSLYAQNVELKSDYESGYDIEQVKGVANALGLVPMEEKTITISIPVQDTLMTEATVWERLSLFFRGLFA